MTPAQRAALQQLADWHESYMWHQDADATTVIGKDGSRVDVNHREAAALLRELAQEPQFEPVAEVVERDGNAHFRCEVLEGTVPAIGAKLYAHPPKEPTPLLMACQHSTRNDCALFGYAHPQQPSCPKCGASMHPGIALQQTYTGLPDFVGGEVVTISPGGPGKLVRCLKCCTCGHSVKVP